MLLILVGVLINLAYAYFLTEEKNILSCYIQFVLNHVVNIKISFIIKGFKFFLLIIYISLYNIRVSL